MNSIIKHEAAILVHGVEARAFNVVAEDATGRIRNQKIGATRFYREKGRSYRIAVELSFDDQCNNGHETFAITATIDEMRAGRYRDYMGGCCHDEIAKRFPEFAHLIKWHLVSTDGPMHYLANTIYHASERDHNGLLKGEKRQLKNGKTGLPAWELVAVVNGEEVPLHKLDRYLDAESEPIAPIFKYAPWCRVGEGKERELDHARSCAVWPDASDEILCSDKETLKAALIARLPGLLESFKADMLAAGFVWPEKREG
jgi:hypothetical protein